MDRSLRLPTGHARRERPSGSFGVGRQALARDVPGPCSIGAPSRANRPSRGRSPIALSLSGAKAELKAEFVLLRAKGLPYVKMARRLGVTKSTLANWNAEFEAEVASARAVELEALQEQFFLLKEGRIRLLGEQLKRLRDALASRDLADVPTERVLELLLKYHATLKEEFVEARPLSDREMARLRSPGA